ncbi:MAG: hypothetical protein C4K60_02520 [Ideonella sp. MAG2]|nr:MAG: hypothetical protein C4K60_02520 [Ideonella sp. MAG2]
MTMHLLYIEAINLSQVIDDTQDLATRRAASQMLLDMVHQVAAKLNGLASAISTGASKGLFEAKSLADLKRAKQIAADVLASPYHNLLQVEVVGTDDLPHVTERFSELTAQLQAEVRRRQACSLTVHWSEPPSTAMLSALQAQHPRMVGKRQPHQVVCQLDQVRPAVMALKGKSRDEPDTPVSWPVAVRRLEGRVWRQKLFKHLLSQDFSAADDAVDDAPPVRDLLERFSNDLESLTKDGNKRLDGKMALLYADGNSFGKIAQACQTPEQLRRWDNALQGARKQFLAKLLDLVRQRRDASGGTALQIEVLMWGGDEFLLVLPAALGLQAAQCFFEHCRPRLPDGVPPPDDLPTPCQPSHAVSLVFAHRNSPIEPLQELVKSLAEQGKQGVYKHHDSLNCIVLESFDHAGQDLDRYWQRRGLHTVHWRDMALNPKRLEDLLAAAPKVLPHLPRSGLYKVLADLVAWVDPSSAPGLLERRYKSLHEQLDSQCKLAWPPLWKALQPQSLGQQPVEADGSHPQHAHLNAWLMLLELWDYLPMSNTATQKEVTA